LAARTTPCPYQVDWNSQVTLALDGKVLRGARLDDHQQFTLFSAMIHGIGVTVGQLQVPHSTTEVTQVGPLIDMIPTTGTDTLITVDAAHTLAALKNLAIGAMRLAGLREIKRTTESIARDRTRAIPLLATS
jgi:hypothetical protein